MYGSINYLNRVPSATLKTVRYFHYLNVYRGIDCKLTTSYLYPLIHCELINEQSSVIAYNTY
uniref:Uncharacterized protein n=1 Tax=Glossina morsitans morsitans TaxID=37546 RepID=A0A1B0FBY2_GLOMM